jgi:hypothetical protein
VLALLRRYLDKTIFFVDSQEASQTKIQRVSIASASALSADLASSTRAPTWAAQVAGAGACCGPCRGCLGTRLNARARLGVGIGGAAAPLVRVRALS